MTNRNLTRRYLLGLAGMAFAVPTSGCIVDELGNDDDVAEEPTNFDDYIEIVDHSFSPGPLGRTTAEVEIKNVSDAEVDQVNIEFELYDEDLRVDRTIIRFISGLPAGIRERGESSGLDEVRSYGTDNITHYQVTGEVWVDFDSYETIIEFDDFVVD